MQETSSVQSAPLALMAAASVPMLPPCHPELKPLVQSVLDAVKKHGASKTAELCRQRAEKLTDFLVETSDGEVQTVLGLRVRGVTSAQLSHAISWLRHRADELDASCAGGRS